jgi:hypothetical protein
MSFLYVRPFTVNDAAFVSSNVTEDDYDEYNPATPYDLEDRVIVIDSDVHNIYESVFDGVNTGNDPQLDTQGDPENPPAFWQLVSTTNRWKMFDLSNSSQTSNADSIEVELLVNRRINAIGLLNISAESARVVMTDATAGVVFDETYSLIESTGSPSYYSWFFGRIVRKTDLYIDGLPPYVNATINIYLNDTGNTVLCGTCLLGYAEDVGATLHGARIGIDDYSVKQQNDFGDTTILPRAFRRRGDFQILASNSDIDRINNTLASYRAQAILYIGTTDFSCTFIYGFYESYDVVIEYTDHSLINITALGLT